MTLFIDTSAFLAVLDGDDKNHQKAKKKWEDLIYADVTLVCSNYVLIETLTLIQNRLGMKAVKAFQEDVVPILTIKWVDESLHQAGVTSISRSQKSDQFILEKKPELNHLGLVRFSLMALVYT